MVVLFSTSPFYHKGKALEPKDLEKMAIIGPGLLGGSLGLALKSRALKTRIVGIGHRRSSLDRAVEIGAIDEGSVDLSAAAGSQLVVLATPIRLIQGGLEALSKILSPGTVVTDVGSTKRTICRWAKVLARHKIEFVGSHPIAGSEKRGVDFARVDLFANANCFITPMPSTPARATELVTELWKHVGMRVVAIDPARHDALLAAVSHLPHVVAAGLVNACTDEQLKFTGTGFLDTTRIASGDVPLWHDILITNPDKVDAALRKFLREMDRFRRAVRRRDSRQICRFLEKAKVRRDELMRFNLEHKEIEA